MKTKTVPVKNSANRQKSGRENHFLPVKIITKSHAWKRKTQPVKKIEKYTRERKKAPVKKLEQNEIKFLVQNISKKSK